MQNVLTLILPSIEFAKMDCGDIASKNTVMSGCLRNDHPEKSLLYLKEMNCSGE